MQIKLTLNHISFRATGEIKRIAMPLLANSPIEFFYYGRNYHDGRALRLHTNNEYYATWAARHDPWKQSVIEEGFYLWDDIQSQAQIDTRSRVGLGNGLLIVKEQGDYTEFFGFAPGVKENLSVMYLNQKEIFDRFILYFKEKAEKTIKQAEDDLIAFTPEYVYAEQQSRPNVCMQKIKELMPIKTIDIPSIGKIQLSKRERSCLEHLLIGRTAREIAEHYELSPKTVETYINRIKQKLKCKTKSQLFQMALDVGIIRPNQSFF